MEIKDYKKNLRKECLGRIEKISVDDVRAKSGKITETILRTLEIMNRRVIGAYFSFGKEVATEEMISELINLKYRLGLPVPRVSAPTTLQTGETKLYSPDMEFRQVSEIESLVPGVYGILEPRNGILIPGEELEVILIPGVAFSRTGKRLGRGGGYYDRYMARLQPGTLKIGLAFSEQLLPSIPVEEHDIELDMVITEKEVIKCH